MFDDRKPEPGSTRFTRARPIHDVKALEDVGQIAERNPDARVAYAQRDGFAAAPDLDVDRTACRSVAKRVVHEVDDDLRKPVRIAAQRRPLARKAQGDAGLRGARFERLEDPRRHAGEIDDFRAQPKMARFDRREIEQIGDQLHHPVDFLFHARQEELERFFVAVGTQDRLDHQVDRRERRAQLVRNVGDKIAAHLFEFVQPRLIRRDEQRAAGSFHRQRRDGQDARLARQVD